MVIEDPPKNDGFSAAERRDYEAASTDGAQKMNQRNSWPRRYATPAEIEMKMPPAMIEAGATALCAVCDELSSKTDSTLESIVRSVYVAMRSYEQDAHDYALMKKYRTKQDSA